MAGSAILFPFISILRYNYTYIFHAVKNKYNNDSEKLNDRYSKK